MEAAGIEPASDFAVSPNGDCLCDFCEGWRAALALQNDGSSWLDLTQLDADLQRMISAWDMLPDAIKRAIFATVATQ